MALYRGLTAVRKDVTTTSASVPAHFAIIFRPFLWATSSNKHSKRWSITNYAIIFLIVKPIRCPNFSNLFFGMKLYKFRTVPPSIIRSFPLYTQQWYMSYSFADSLQAGSGCYILIMLASCLQNCMTYTIAVCTVKNFWWWTEEMSETYRISFQNKFEKSVHLVIFIIRT
jgi:hypothetical protein